MSNLHCAAVQDKALEIERLAHFGDQKSIGPALEALVGLTEQMMLEDGRGSPRPLEGQMHRPDSSKGRNEGSSHDAFRYRNRMASRLAINSGTNLFH